MPANSQSIGEIVHQLVNYGLLFEKIRILVVNVSTPSVVSQEDSLMV